MNGIDFYPTKKLSSISKAYSKFYKNWNHKKYENYIKYFGIDNDKKLNELSAGMKINFYFL